MNALPTVFTRSRRTEVKDNLDELRAQDEAQAGSASSITPVYGVHDFIDYVIASPGPVTLDEFKLTHKIKFDDDLVCDFIFNVQTTVQPEWRAGHGLKYFKV